MGDAGAQKQAIVMGVSDRPIHQNSKRYLKFQISWFPSLGR